MYCDDLPEIYILRNLGNFGYFRPVYSHKLLTNFWQIHKCINDKHFKITYIKQDFQAYPKGTFINITSYDVETSNSCRFRSPLNTRFWVLGEFLLPCSRPRLHVTQNSPHNNKIKSGSKVIGDERSRHVFWLSLNIVNLIKTKPSPRVTKEEYEFLRKVLTM